MIHAFASAATLKVAAASSASTGHVTSTAFAALIWWTVPVVIVTIAIGYVVWTSKFKDKFENETNRSVDKFQLFQQTLREPDSEH